MTKKERPQLSRLSLCINEEVFLLSIIAYREWEVWQNTSFFKTPNIISGYYIFHLTPSLMLEQTIQFLHEKTDLSRTTIDPRIKGYFFPLDHSTNVLQKLDDFDTTKDINDIINEKLQEIKTLSLCLDFPINCNAIEFFIPMKAKVFFANRKNIGRGLGFEIEERGLAIQKLVTDYKYFHEAPESISAAQKHYLSGLTLLSLEDMYPGLIDAAFMQFYQGCEILCGSNYKLEKAKKHIAKLYNTHSELLQIVIHHIWQVRHSYFGHGNNLNHLFTSNDSAHTYQIAKQVLVARWLCKTLLDLQSPSKTSLIREMRFYKDDSSEEYRGTIEELEKSFKVDYDYRNIPIFDEFANKISNYELK